MSKQRSKPISLIFAGVAVWFGLACGNGAWAGPARYDPETRSMRFTYTYAALVDGQFGEAAIGAPQKPTNEQDATIRTVVLKVSDALSKATAGRLKISTLDLVPDVKLADVVISLTGKPARGGWAMAGAIEGRPGQIGLYYQTLADELEQDYVLTAAHEVCHYVFGVVDEYNFPSGCPSSNPGGPGCLMDNYLSQGTRHGWYGRFCSVDHVSDPAQRQSCQEIVDKFFRDRNVTTIGPADDSASMTTVAAVTAETSVRNRKSKIDNISRAAIGMLREQFQAKIKDKKSGAALSSITSLRGVAQSFLKAQLDLNQIGLSKEEQKDLVEGALKQTAAMVKVAIPPRFVPIAEVIGKLANERAQQLRQESPKDSDRARQRKIRQGLLAFLSGLSGAANAPTIEGKLTTEETKYLDHIAMQAATLSEEKKLNEELYRMALEHIRLDRETAGTVLDIAGELGVVGIENRLAALGEVDADLRAYMPGRTASTGFGRRRTIIIDPDPLDPAQDFVFCLSGIYRYTEIRDQCVDLFSKLVERAKIEVLKTDAQKTRLQARGRMLALTPQQRSLEERNRRLAEMADRNKVRVQREAELRATISELSQQIRRNRVENIVFLIPPGGLPHDIGAIFESLRRQLIVKGDVRLDIVMVGPDYIPYELRDIAVGSGGSISTIADIDEVGAVAQRLKNDQSSGSWVVLPHQDEIAGPRTDFEPTQQRTPHPWLLTSTQGGRLLGNPIALPYLDLLSRINQLDQYFNKELSPDARDGRIERMTKFNYDLSQAGVLSPEAILSLRTVVQEGLRGKSKTDCQGEAEQVVRGGHGLIGEFEILNETIQRYNGRNPGIGSGVELRSTILEHLVIARRDVLSLESSLDVALAAHAKFLAPEYDEYEVIHSAYQRLDEVYKKFGTSMLSAKVLDLTSGNLKLFERTEYENTDLYLERYQEYQETRQSRSPKDARAADDFMQKVGKNFAGVKRPLVLPPAEPKRAAWDVRSLDRAFWENYPDKLRIDLILASFDREAARRDHVVIPLPLSEAGADERDVAAFVNEQRRSSAPTLAYIGLAKQKIRLRAMSEFLDRVERDLASSFDKPLAERIDRRALVLAMERLQDAVHGGIDPSTGEVKHRPLAPVDLFTIEDGLEKRRSGAFRLPRFYAENVLFNPKSQSQAEFELIIGFSKPLPGVDIAAIRENNTELLPELRLYNDNGQNVNTPTLQLDRDISTPTCLVYHFSPEFKEEGWYTGALLLKQETYRAIMSDVINFTFSVASTRPNFRLNAALVQQPNDPELIPPPPNRGLSRVMDRRAKIEVQVFGGTSILGAAIRGVLYKIGEGTDMINPIGQTFYDDGETSGDRTKGDGVYTTTIPLDQIEKGMEYRVLIQAESTGKSRNIAPEDPNANDAERRKQAIAQGVKTVRPEPAEETVAVKPEPAVIFQRASSIQIRVER